MFAVAPNPHVVRSALAVVCICVVSGGCGSRVRSFHIVVPNGFKGEVMIVEHHSAPPATQDEAGRYLFRVPDSGVLKVPSFRPFEMAHRWSAEYESGQPIPCYPGDPGYSKTAVLFQELGTRGQGKGPDIVICFVGTDMESRGDVPYYE